jgi:hypothetical protein
LSKENKVVMLREKLVRCAALAAISLSIGISAHAAIGLTGSSAHPAVATQYRFKPTVVGAAAGRQLKFSAKGHPTWMTFDAATGTLSGTPAAADKGKRYGIYISVTDGAGSAWLPVNLQVQAKPSAPVTALVPSGGKTYAVTLSWKPPISNIDSSALTNLAGYRILYGTAANKLHSRLELPGSSHTSARIEGLAAGTYFFALKAYRRDGVESDLTEILWKTVT